MKNAKLTTFIFGFLLFSCNQVVTKTTSSREEKTSVASDDREQIQNLIRQVLNWADTKNSIDILPVIPDYKSGAYNGFDLEKHKQNLDKLRQTDFFATGFIENYNQIILTLDKGLKNGKYDAWLVGDLPTFKFANDQSPWCNCLDYGDWSKVEVRIIRLNSHEGELEWRWGGLNADTNSSWKDFVYKFKVIKENDKWKIAFLQGFDLAECLQKY